MVFVTPLKLAEQNTATLLRIAALSLSPNLLLLSR
jgi:hypothetical protein